MTDPHQPPYLSPGNPPFINPAPSGYPQNPGGNQGPRTGIIVGLAVLAILVVLVAVAAIVGVVVFTRSSNSDPAAERGQSASTVLPWHTDPGAPQTTSTVATPTRSVPPPLVREPDSYGESCGAGFQLSGRSGWGTSAGRGSVETSCSFARSVLQAYWDQYGSPSTERRTVTAAGSVPCPSTGGRCNGNDFVMECAALGNDPWITCTGGRNARVYIY